MIKPRVLPGLRNPWKWHPSDQHKQAQRWPFSVGHFSGLKQLEHYMPPTAGRIHARSSRLRLSTHILIVELSRNVATFMAKICGLLGPGDNPNFGDTSMSILLRNLCLRYRFERLRDSAHKLYSTNATRFASYMRWLRREVLPTWLLSSCPIDFPLTWPPTCPRLFALSSLLLSDERHATAPTWHLLLS